MTTITVKDGNNTNQTVTLAPSALQHGLTTVGAAGTAVPLGSSATLYRGVHIKASSTNTGNIYIGSSSVSSADGFVLEPGEELLLAVDNVATVYVDAANNGSTVTWLGS